MVQMRGFGDMAGVLISFTRQPQWRGISVFSLVNSENNWPGNLEMVGKRRKKNARLASGFVFLLANPEFYSHFGEMASGYPYPCMATFH
jgi:hypothetical protein